MSDTASTEPLTPDSPDWGRDDAPGYPPAPTVLAEARWNEGHAHTLLSLERTETAAGPAFRVAIWYEHDLEPLPLLRAVDADELGHLLTARGAPGRPEIEDHDLAAQVAELHLATAQLGEAEVRRRAADLRRRRAPRVGREEFSADAPLSGRPRAGIIPPSRAR